MTDDKKIFLKKTEKIIEIIEEKATKKADKYKEHFNKDYLMGPNIVRLLEEMLEKCRM